MESQPLGPCGLASASTDVSSSDFSRPSPSTGPWQPRQLSRTEGPCVCWEERRENEAGADGHRAPIPGETGCRVVLRPGAELTSATFIPGREWPPSVASDPPSAQRDIDQRCQLCREVAQGSEAVCLAGGTLNTVFLI